jgi:hypothetical protein
VGDPNCTWCPKPAHELTAKIIRKSRENCCSVDKTGENKYDFAGGVVGKILFLVPTSKTGSGADVHPQRQFGSHYLAWLFSLCERSHRARRCMHLEQLLASRKKNPCTFGRNYGKRTLLKETAWWGKTYSYEQPCSNGKVDAVAS